MDYKKELNEYLKRMNLEIIVEFELDNDENMVSHLTVSKDDKVVFSFKYNRKKMFLLYDDKHLLDIIKPVIRNKNIDKILDLL